MVILLLNNCHRSKKVHNIKGLLPQRSIQATASVGDTDTN